MKILICVASQQKGFFISLGKELSQEHNLRFVPYDNQVHALIKRLAPEQMFGDEIVQDNFSIDISECDVVCQAKAVEDAYNIKLSFLIAQDRGLGKGYLLNADCYPDIARSWWSHEQKLMAILKEFRFSEELINTQKPDIIIGIQKQPALWVVANRMGIPYYTFAPVKLGARFLISDDEFLTNKTFLDKVRYYAESDADKCCDVDEEYAQEAGSKLNHSLVSYSWTRILRNVVEQIVNDTKRLLRGTRKKDGYRLFGWLPVLFRRKFAYEYFRKYGKRPEHLKKYRLVYIPLHLEPEISIQGISPEFNNSLEMISWVSKAVPANAMLVIKEQPFSFGIRSKKYYDMLRRIGNVTLADPDVKSWTWIDACDLVVAITGTVGVEAVNFHRPVLSCGAHQAINLLPTVRHVTNYFTTRRAVDELLALDRDSGIFSHAKWAYRKAQQESSFDFSGFEKTFASEELQPELANKAVTHLYEMYPNVFGRHN